MRVRPGVRLPVTRAHPDRPPKKASATTSRSVDYTATLSPAEPHVRASHAGAPDIAITTRMPIHPIMAKHPDYALDSRSPHASLHWVLDETFDEDRARNRADNAPENLAVLRKLSLNMLRNARRDLSISLKRKRVGWSNQIAYDILGQMR